jgi:pilus assembly protein Flp/PilA
MASPDIPRAASFEAMRASLRRWLADESGQDVIEYALVAAAVGFGTVAGVHGLAHNISSYLNIVLNAFESATSAQL